MLYLALSCFQGRRAGDAAEELVALAPGRVGLQLTPGCAPGPLAVTCPTRTHHGYTTHALRAPVWDGGTLVWHGDSVHPPLARRVPDDWQPPDGVVLETMYPGYAALADGDGIAAAMDAGRWLAVDVAHLDIQMYHGLIRQIVLNRLMDYERVAEVHVSTSHEHRDAHARITAPAWGVEWARTRLAAGTPVVLECYMHHLSSEERLGQVAMMLGQ
ncbi:MAG TPA: hypothetical protein VH092_06410 [Urbifossiella sp.]|jgi:hypothetical protein|nr:hypothetical protein [Urbifossiella sp.]